MGVPCVYRTSLDWCLREFSKSSLIYRSILPSDRLYICTIPISGCMNSINRILVLSSPDTSHEPGGPKPTHQEPRGSTSDCITLVPRKTCHKSDRQEPLGSTSDRLVLVLRKIYHVQTQNNITEPYISYT